MSQAQTINYRTRDVLIFLLVAKHEQSVVSISKVQVSNQSQSSTNLHHHRHQHGCLLPHLHAAGPVRHYIVLIKKRNKT